MRLCLRAGMFYAMDPRGSGREYVIIGGKIVFLEHSVHVLEDTALVVLDVRGPPHMATAGLAAWGFQPIFTPPDAPPAAAAEHSLLLPVLKELRADGWQRTMQSHGGGCKLRRWLARCCLRARGCLHTPYSKHG